MGRNIRVAVLLFILLTVAVGTWQARVRTTSWDRALDVVVFPINADGTTQTAEYIRGLGDDAFEPIRTFMRDEAREYGISLLNPVDVYIGPEVDAMPPEPPVGASVPMVVLSRSIPQTARLLSATSRRRAARTVPAPGQPWRRPRPSFCPGNSCCRQD